VAALACIQDSEQIIIHAGKQHKAIKADELKEFVGERGRRGRRLPRGYQKIISIKVQLP
jgi:topoisomerase-4 subunit A